jgi:Ca2+-binding EF-hand superfamily protein
MDENFDGRISYAEMREHFERLGFNIADLEGTQITDQSGSIKQA